MKTQKIYSSQSKTCRFLLDNVWSFEISFAFFVLLSTLLSYTDLTLYDQSNSLIIGQSIKFFLSCGHSKISLLVNQFIQTLLKWLYMHYIVNYFTLVIKSEITKILRTIYRFIYIHVYLSMHPFICVFYNKAIHIFYIPTRSNPP